MALRGPEAPRIGDIAIGGLSSKSTTSWQLSADIERRHGLWHHHPLCA